MIVVRYKYLRKKDQKIKQSSAMFYEPSKALRFMKSLVNDTTGTKWYINYYTDDQEENEWLWSRI